MSVEKERLNSHDWQNWGPYVSNRQWGNVREDYSPNGNAWNFTNHDSAESYTYRWGEEGIAGISDHKQLLCFALSFWNGKDKMVKERLFGLSNPQGNHGEDVKELFYYLDNTPTHSYMKMLYKYPINEFPYDDILNENASRSKREREYEIIDTGIFDNDEYFDIFIEYCKADKNDILVRVTVHNRSNVDAPLTVLPTLWFRNNWKWGYNEYKGQLNSYSNNHINIYHDSIGIKKLYTKSLGETLFCENETNRPKIYGCPEKENTYYKDGINNYITKNEATVNPEKRGSKAAISINKVIKAGDSEVFEFNLSSEETDSPFENFDQIFAQRINEADEFYKNIQEEILNEDERNVQRQAFAGLLWNKQFYHYNVGKWLKGDPNFEAPRNFNDYVRNVEWDHLHNKDIISMPDKWEYPWYATWDLAFHCVPFAIIDADFAKNQLLLLTKEWYMHPNGQMPAYEWNLSDVNPPVHAWSCFRVFKIDEKHNGKPDLLFLEKVFQKLLLNFTWWVNRKDKNGQNIFGGGFLGLDNIGAFDRNMELRDGEHLEQADGTSWMAMYALNMMRIAMELAQYYQVYEDMAIKFFEHYLYIAEAMENLGEGTKGLWNEEDGFFYDVLQLQSGDAVSLRLRSIVGLIPLFAVEIIDHHLLEKMPNFQGRMEWILKNKPELAKLVSHWDEEGQGRKHLMSIVRRTRLTKVLTRMLDEKEFLSQYGIRAMSKVYEENPFIFSIDGVENIVYYTPAESDSRMFGGNSNWRGPIWFPINFLIVESLQRFHFYYGNSFKVEFPTGSGEKKNLDEVAQDISHRLCSIFLKDENGRRAFNGEYDKFNFDENFKDYITFFEYFHGDNGRGVGASHQTGWTATVAKLLKPRMNF